MNIDQIRLPSELDDIVGFEADRLREFAERFYKEGFQHGADFMRHAILSAAQAPIATPAASPSRATANASVKDGKSARAPRGSVRAAIQAVLAAHPAGLSELELGEAAAKRDASVSPRSMGGELRRMRDRLYRFDRGKWFLIAHQGKSETAGEEAPAVPSTATAKEESDDPGTAIAA